MRIREVEYSRLFSIGNYQNERIGFRAELDEQDSPEEVVITLAQKVIELEYILEKYRKIEELIEHVKEQLERATDRSELPRSYGRGFPLHPPTLTSLSQGDLAATKKVKIRYDELLDYEKREKTEYVLEKIDDLKRELEGLRLERDRLLERLEKYKKMKDDFVGLIKRGDFKALKEFEVR